MIGRLAYLILLLIFNLQLVAGYDFAVELYDQQGQVLNVIERNLPFQFYVRVKGDGKHDRIELPSNLVGAKFDYLRTSLTINQINGVVTRSAVYQFLARIDVAGDLELSPIKLWSQQNLVATHSTKLTVVEPQVSQVSNLPRVTLQLNQNEFYVGEEFWAKVKFYYSSKEQVSSPKISLSSNMHGHFELIESLGPTFGRELVNGGFINFAEWRVRLRAEQAGRQILAPVELSFQRLDQIGQLFMFNTFSNVNLFSNAVELLIKKLPPTQIPVSMIGQLDSFTLELDKNQVQVGDAVQLKLILKGTANWSKVTPPILSLPNNLISYVGKISLDHEQKVFEYILQGIEPGETVIPAQKLFYFDVLESKYRTLATDPMQLQILPGASSVVQNKPSDAIPNSNELVFDSLINPILQTPDHIVRQFGYQLPIDIFGFLTLLPFLFLIFNLIYGYPSRSELKKVTLSNTLHQSQPDIVKFYHELCTFFVSLGVPQTSFSIELIDAKLSELGLASSKRAEFRYFFYELQATIFADSSYENILEKAKCWAAILEQLGTK